LGKKRILIKKVLIKKNKEPLCCNFCGSLIGSWKGEPFDHIHIEKRWGYLSEKDNETHVFNICEACYDKLAASFVLPPEIKSIQTI